LDENIELIEGDIIETVEMYVRDNPELKISFLNLDVDIYEPSAAILEHLYPRVVPGGVVLLDDYGTFPGETRAVDEYFGEDLPEIHKFPFAMTPCYIEK
jgi:predicted O-methyltransferase YrrM